MRLLLFMLTLSILSCGQNETKQKELELKEREIALKEKELELRIKDSVNNNTKTATLTTGSNNELIENDTNDVSVIATSVKLPITVSKLNTLIGAYTSFDAGDDNTGNESIYSWKLKNGLVIMGFGDYNNKPNLSEKFNILYFKTNGNKIVINCIYDLSLNKTSLTECKQNFSNLIKHSSEYHMFIKDKYYYYLRFNENNILIEFSKSTFAWREEGGG